MLSRRPSNRHTPRHGRRSRVLAACVAGVAIAACGDATVSAVLGPELGPGGVGALDGSVGGDAASGVFIVDGGSVVLPDGNVVQGFCAGSGALVQLPQGAWTGDVGKRTFLFAACTCGDTLVSGALKTDSINSSGAATSGKTASLGTNGAFHSNAHIDVGGSIWSAAGAPAVSLATQGSIATELRAAGQIAIDGAFTVGGDIYTSGGVDLKSGSLTCGGKLHASSGAPTSGVSASGGVVTESVTVAPPCPCTKLLDVAGTVQSFATNNDDNVLGVAPSLLASSAAHDVTLACGRYYFDGMAGDVTLHLLGRTAVFVAGNANNGSITLDLTKDAEVDLFIAGNLALNGTFKSNAPAAKVRVYIGGDSVTVSGVVGLDANVYAPNAVVQLSSAFEMAGSILAKQLLFSGDFTIHYDEAILDTPGCDPPGHACDTCHDCSGGTPACIGNKCVPCVTNSDCCAPLVCRSGRCVPDIR